MFREWKETASVLLDLEAVVAICVDISGASDSVAVETARVTPAEAVVSGLVVCVVGDDTVVACLRDQVGRDDWTNIRTTSALGHGRRLTGLHLGHALLGAAHVGCMALALVILGLATAHEGKEPLALLGGRRLIYRNEQLMLGPSTE